MTTIVNVSAAQWLGRIAAIGAVALLLGSAAAEARPSHANPAIQERSGSKGAKHSRAFVGEKMFIQMPAW